MYDARVRLLYTARVIAYTHAHIYRERYIYNVQQWWAQVYIYICTNDIISKSKKNQFLQNVNEHSDESYCFCFFVFRSQAGFVHYARIIINSLRHVWYCCKDGTHHIYIRTPQHRIPRERWSCERITIPSCAYKSEGECVGRWLYYDGIHDWDVIGIYTCIPDNVYDFDIL